MTTEPKRILIFSLVYLPNFVGGAEIAVKEITDRIDSVTFEMVTLRTERLATERIGNVLVHRFGPYVGGKSISQKIQRTVMKYLFPFWGYYVAKRLHQKQPFQVSWAIMANYAGFAALFFKLRFPKVRFVLTLQEGDPITYIKRRVALVYPLFVKIFRTADKVQAISHYLAQFATSMGYPGTPVVIPNGVDIEKFTHPYTEEEKKTLRNRLGILPEDKVLITTSRLVTKNGIEDVISAVSLLPSEYKFLIIGIGDLEKRLRDRVSQLQLEHRVLFIGHVPHHELPLYLQASDIFIRPSLSEGLGNSFLEAMAAGIPIIATAVGGIPDFLEHRQTGMVCDVQNPESIMQQVKDLEDNSLRSQIITKGSALVATDYNWERVARRMGELFKA
jgi:glycosyltransferase involved in cell wall biosynthesis